MLAKLLESNFASSLARLGIRDGALPRSECRSTIHGSANFNPAEGTLSIFKGVVQVAIIKVSASLVKSAITHHYSDSIKSPLAHLESHFYF